MTSLRSLTKAMIAVIALGTASLAVAAAPVAAVDTASPVVISEVYGGGGNTGASYARDFVELYNNSAAAIDLGSMSVQYASAAGTSWTNTTNLTGSIPANGFYLVAEAAGTVLGAPPLPPAEVSGGINLSGSAGKVALVANQDVLTCGDTCANAAGVVDFVGYGANASDKSPGFAPAGGLSNTTSAQRRIVPFANTGVNSADFTVAAPTAKAPPVAGPAAPDCSTTPVPAACVPGPTTIQDIQGDGFVSPLAGSTVGNVAGIVTAVRATGSSKGFWIQEQSPDAGRTTASSGVFVFTSSATVAAGDAVLVSGRVSDFYIVASGETLPTASTLSTTELSPSSIVTVSTGNPLPEPLVLGPATVPPVFAPAVAGGNVEAINPVDPTRSVQEFFEAHEGMRVQVDDARVVGPGNSFGEIYVTTKPTDQATPRGGTYLGGYDLVPTGRLLVTPVSGSVPPANVGDVLGGATIGPVDWSTFGGYEIAATQVGTRIDNGLTGNVAAPQADDQLAIATYNVENLAPGDPQAKYDRLGAGVVTNLASPDIISVEEIQDDDGADDTGVVAADVTITKLTAAITAAGGPSYLSSQIDPVDDQDGGQPGGNIRVVFLYNPARVDFVSKPGGDATTAVSVGAGPDGTAELSVSPGRVDPTNEAWNTSRKPLAGEFEFRGWKVVVVANHFNSKGGDQSSDGRFQPPTRSSEIQRTKQAVVLNNFVEQVLAADPDANVVLAGDFNDYQFSAPITTLTGDGATLTDLINTLPVNERYTYVFNGISQVLDHIFVTKPLGDVEYDVIHVNSEFADQASDHDPQVVRVRPTERRGTVVVDPAGVLAGGAVQVALSGWYPNRQLTVALDDGAGTVVTTDATGAATTTIAIPATTAPGAHTVTVTTALGTTASATLNVTAPPPPVRRGVVAAVPIATAGSSVVVVVAGWSANTALAISLDGDPPLTTVTTDRFGVRAFTLAIPATTAPGVHRIVATAADGTNNSATLFVLRRR